MPNYISRPTWHLPDSAATDETVFLNRRTFLKAMGFGGLTAGGLSMPSFAQGPTPTAELPLPKYSRHPQFADVGRPLTHEYVGTTFNNFWEFTRDKNVFHYAKDFKLDPYALTIDGLVEKPLKLGLEDIERLGYEERIYRFRCVEAWSMTVPWMGVPLAKLVALAKPKSEATFVAFKSFYDPEQAPEQRVKSKYQWPYYEGLRMDEATNEMGFVATGAYGKRLLPQSGTPLRVITPWKYGYKGPKSVVRMTFIDYQPPTFWSDSVKSGEYPFYSNVDPEVPHPRWSQAIEKHIVDKANVADIEEMTTLRFNGYEAQVGHMYKDLPRKLI